MTTYIGSTNQQSCGKLTERDQKKTGGRSSGENRELMGKEENSQNGERAENSQRIRRE